MTRFHVLIPSYNCSQWIARCLVSVAHQAHQPASVLLIDDASTEPMYDVMARGLCAHLGFQYHRNAVNEKCPKNLWTGIQALPMEREDVIFILDGDDFLPHDRVLTRLVEVYADPQVFLTYGNYEPHPKNTGQTKARAYPPEVLISRRFRQHYGACFNHPLTFRRLLWDQLEESDLKKADGTWFRGGYDLVIMMPMLELCGGEHLRFLDETLYMYNAVNPISDSTVNRELVEASREVLSRPMKVWR